MAKEYVKDSEGEMIEKIKPETKKYEESYRKFMEYYVPAHKDCNHCGAVRHKNYRCVRCGYE
ncbi:hypothetical protein [Burkholderia phage vB_BpP_HN04]|nr:hypothetical protein [Burkholderia phage vB_BpP_HN01]